ncbi:hypothetical protein GH714_037407 [Hevea brasiliensis]|uniref:Haem-binding uptake Tiki superfamily ChaN domain-containing protein n=1 Tax=Hevea brasiliensis TaxID=3981 RepID=A0A6A6L880_HEVBR|nr:hypothetical protein GH714_037407 [Hevea brasiliensis]
MRNWSLKLPVKDDKELELEIFKNLRKRCVENEKSISLAMEANPCDLQPQLNQYMDRSIDGETFKSYLSYWPPQRWQEYEPLLSCCRDNGVRIVACGTPLKVIRTVHAKGIRRLSKADRKIYVPPPGSGLSQDSLQFHSVEIARVMNAAGRRQDALPQIIAGIVEHRISDAFASQTLLVDMLSFVVRTINSYWGTQQWVDLARYSGLHGKNGKSSSYHTPGSATEAIVGCNSSQDASIDEIKNQ